MDILSYILDHSPSPDNTVSFVKAPCYYPTNLTLQRTGPSTIACKTDDSQFSSEFTSDILNYYPHIVKSVTPQDETHLEIMLHPTIYTDVFFDHFACWLANRGVTVICFNYVNLQ